MSHTPEQPATGPEKEQLAQTPEQSAPEQDAPDTAAAHEQTPPAKDPTGEANSQAVPSAPEAPQKIPAEPQTAASTPSGKEGQPLKGSALAAAARSTLPPKPCMLNHTAYWGAKFAPVCLLILGFMAFWPRLLPLLPTSLAPGLRDVWFVGESSLAAVAGSMSAQGAWLVPRLDGLAFTATMPLYIWLGQAVSSITGLLAADALWLISALCASALLASTWFLARTVGMDGKKAFASGLVLCATMPFMGFGFMASPAMLTSLLVIWSLICLYKGWVKESAPLWLGCGFALAALSALSGGLLGLLLPLAASVVFLVWRTAFARAFARDGAIAFGLMLVILGGWFLALSLHQGGGEAVNSLSQAFRATLSGWQAQQALERLGLLAVGLPWIGLVAFVPWEKLPQGLVRCVQARKQEPGFIWITACFTSALALLVLWPGTDAGVALTVLAPLWAMITASALYSLGPLRARLFWLWIALYYVVEAIGKISAFVLLLAGSFLPENWLASIPGPVMELLRGTRGLWLMALVLVLGAALLVRHALRYRSNSPQPEDTLRETGGALMVAALISLIFMQTASLVVMPSLDAAFSPRPQARQLAEADSQGASIATLGFAPGVFSLYAERPVTPLQGLEALRTFVEEHPDSGILMPHKTWQDVRKAMPEKALQAKTLEAGNLGLVPLVLVRLQAVAEPDTTLPAVAAPEEKSPEAASPEQAPDSPEQQNPAQEPGAVPEEALPDNGTNNNAQAAPLPEDELPAPEKAPQPSLAEPLPAEAGQAAPEAAATEQTPQEASRL